MLGSPSIFNGKDAASSSALASYLAERQSILRRKEVRLMTNVDKRAEEMEIWIPRTRGKSQVWWHMSTTLVLGR